MSDSMIEHINWRIAGLHRMILEVTRDLTQEQISWRPSCQAPPIGWHLWHIARWADRLQASFPAVDGKQPQEIWDEEEFVQRWGLNTSELGLYQTGAGMDHDAAVTLPEQVGQDRLYDYAERCFTVFATWLDGLTPQQMAWLRPRVLSIKITKDKRILTIPATDAPLGAELAFHCTHAARHLGMIEALRGAQGLDGTASV